MTEQRGARTESPGGGALRLEDEFGYAIGAIFRAHVKAVEAAVGDVPGGSRGYLVLAAAVQGEAGSQRALAERLGVDRTVMTYLLDDLERAGLVERRPDPSDRRNRHVVATEHGAKLLDELRVRVGLVEERMLDVLPEESRESFRAMLAAVARHVSGGTTLADICRLVPQVDGPENPEKEKTSHALRRG
ncbi:MAG TPA: MarR family transcriptional regulator [Spirillospora sp.]